MNLASFSPRQRARFAPTGAAELIIDLVPQTGRPAQPAPRDAAVFDALLIRAECTQDAALRALEAATALLQCRQQPTRAEVLEHVAAAERALSRMSLALAALRRGG